MIHFKKTKALFRKHLKESKKIALQTFTSEISPSSKIARIWSNNNTFCCRKPKHDINCISSPNDSSRNIAGKSEIAQTFAIYWSDQAADESFSTVFQQKKAQLESLTTLLAPCAEALMIDENINFIEFSSALNSLKGKTPGRDRISYPMLKNLSNPVTQRLINLFNRNNLKTAQSYPFTNRIP